MQRVSDPRTIVTPDAFSVSPDLLGVPLAPPSRRLFAVFVDLVLIFLISRSGWVLLGFIASIVLLRIATRRAGDQGIGNMFRVAVGCAGAAILLTTGIAFWAVRTLSNAVDVPAVGVTAEGEPANAPVGLGTLLGGLAEGRDLARAESADEAAETGLSLLQRMVAAGVDVGEARAAIAGIVPEDAPWRDQVLERVGRAADSIGGSRRADQPDTIPLADALSAYADAIGGDSAALRSERAIAARRRILDAVGADSLEALHDEITQLRTASRRTEQELESTREALREAEEGSSVFGFLREVVDDLGLTFGWGGLYMTLFLAGWGGRTPGKRIAGIRVVQLDGAPLSWWMAFERAGGYAAGFATGLLGFAQVFWNPNRQAIHDRIAGTVVIIDGAEPVPGHWQAPVAPAGAASPTAVPDRHVRPRAETRAPTGRRPAPGGAPVKHVVSPEPLAEVAETEERVAGPHAPETEAGDFESRRSTEGVNESGSGAAAPVDPAASVEGPGHHDGATEREEGERPNSHEPPKEGP